MEIIAQGAEAIVYLEDNVIIKERLSKQYRIPELDSKIIKSRSKKEAKILLKLSEAGINVPKLLKVENNKIYMDYIDGNSLKTVLNDTNQSYFMKLAGEIVGKMHNHNVIHGDLTTLNFMVQDEKIFIIDFGLGFCSFKDEDKAVDLYVFERALKCAHKEDYLVSFYESYSKVGSTEVLDRLEKVRLRGRKREESEFE